MAVLEGLLQSVVDEPACEANWLVLADWLEENDDPRRAELLRLHRQLLATCCEPDLHPDRRRWQARIVELLTQGVRPCVPQRVVVLGKRVKLPLNFAWLPPGAFLMGSPPEEQYRGDDERRHRVTLTRGFWLATHLVTQAQWRVVFRTNPRRFKGRDLPVENVSWEDCQELCARLGPLVGRRFRLPSEAEWEWACRAGTTTPFFFGATISADQANYDGDYTYGRGRRGVRRQGRTTPVGSFPPNAWGLTDLHGNVYEWCADWYGTYPAGDESDPPGAEGGDARVVRGGCWCCVPDSCRSAARHRYAPASRNHFFGCRMVLCPD
jgi:sulfatase modifying factor 1